MSWFSRLGETFSGAYCGICQSPRQIIAPHVQSFCVTFFYFACPPCIHVRRSLGHAFFHSETNFFLPAGKDKVAVDFDFVVRYASNLDLKDGEYAFVDLSRGSKVNVQTENCVVVQKNVTWNQTLELSCTLYHSGGAFQAKPTEFSIKTSKGKDVIKAEVDVAQFASLQANSKEASVPLGKGVELHMTVFCWPPNSRPKESDRRDAINKVIVAATPPEAGEPEEVQQQENNEPEPPAPAADYVPFSGSPRFRAASAVEVPSSTAPISSMAPPSKAPPKQSNDKGADDSELSKYVYISSVGYLDHRFFHHPSIQPKLTIQLPTL
jgi:hypothetical protein